MRDIYLMYKDIPVVIVRNNNSVFEVKNESLLPWYFKDNIKEVSQKIDFNRAIANSQYNYRTITTWLSWRTLVLSQRYAKKLYQAYGLIQKDDADNKARIALMYKALSLSDNYWVTNDPSDKWVNLNLRTNTLHNAVAQVSLHGRSLSLDGHPDPYAFSTCGVYAKAWHRDPDGSLWLYKSSTLYQESEIEVMCSNILDCCNVSHCHYEVRYDDDLYVAACPAMTSDTLSISDIDNLRNFSIRDLAKIDNDNFMRMLIVDYLLSNRDRHTQNWGIYYKADTMEILGLHPLFDHNNAFDVDVMNNESYKSHLLNHTLKENALYAMNRVDFHFTKEITRDLFMNDLQYKTFKKRADQLGIKTQKLTLDDIYVQCGGFPKYKDEVFKLLPKNLDNELMYQAMLSALQLVQGTHNCYR